MTAKTFLGGSVAAILCLTSSAIAHETDNEKGPEQVHDLSGFSKIEIAGVYKLDVVVGGDAFSVVTSGKARDTKNMRVYVKGDTLILGQDEDKKISEWGGRKGSHNNGVHVEISMPKLIALEIAGVGTGEIAGIDSDDMAIDVAGISDMVLKGSCGVLNADVAGMGSLDASKLKCRDVTVSMAGMGSAEVYASESVDANIGGMGSIDVYGKPKNVRRDKSFMSSVTVH